MVAFVHLFFCVRKVFFLALAQIIKVVALSILYMFWTGDTRDGSSMSFSFLWHSSTFSCLHQLLLPSDGFSMRTVTSDHTLTGTQSLRLLSDMISLTTCHTPSCMETDVTFVAVTHVSAGRYAAACFYHLSPLSNSLETLLFILGKLSGSEWKCG